jgi:uncharacterized protein (DUF2147 family)
MKIKFAISVLVFSTSLYNATAQKINKSADAIIGKWMGENNEYQVDLYKDAAGKYAAKIIWFVVVTKGKTMADIVDKNNPNPKLKTRKWLGMQTLSGLEYDGKNKWVNGEIYVPKTGKTYSAKCTLTSKNNLEVRGFIGISLLGETIKFYRTK